MNPSTYVKNVGKSFGYIGYDIFQSFNPNLASMMTETKDLAKDIKESARTMYSSAGQKLNEMDLKNAAKNYGKDTWSNFKSDLKSGNFYNRDRKNAASDAAMKAMFDGEDFDFDFDDDFNFDDDGEDYGDGTKESDLDMSETLVETSNNQISAATANTNYLAETISASQEHSTKKIIAGNVASAEYLASIQRQTAGTICSVVERSSASIVNQLANIGMGVTAIAQLSEPMAVHFQNASTYYTKSTELQQKMVESLEKLVENTTPVDTRFKSKTKYTTIDDLVGLSGFSPKAYADMLTQNFKDMKESISPMLDMLKMFSGGGPLNNFKNSPVSSLMTMGLNFMMPKDTKKAMENFNDTLPAFFKSLIGGMEDKDFGLIGNMIKDFFLPKNRFLDKLDPSNYNKGKADWTGKDSKALTEVIPYQLSLLVSAITGQDQKIFDYDSGKWKRVAAVKTEWNNMKLKEGLNAGGDYRTFLNDALSNLSSGGGISDEQRQLMQREIDSYFQSTVAERGDRFRDVNKDDFDYTKSGMSKETWEFMRQINKSIGEQNNLFAKFVGDVYSARNTYGKKIREMSESGESVFNALFNNSLFDDEDEKEILKAKKEADKAKGIKDEPNISVNLGTDKYGYNIWFYLQGLYQHTKHISDNLGNIGGAPSSGSLLDLEVLQRNIERGENGTRLFGAALPEQTINSIYNDLLYDRLGIGPSRNARRANNKGGNRSSITPIEALIPKRETAEQITQQREQKTGAQTVSRVSDSAINSAVQEVLNHSRSGGSLIKLSQKAQEYKIMRDSAIATGQPYAKDEKLEKEIEEVEAKNEEIQKAYDKVAGGAIVTTAKEFQSSLSNIIGAPTRMISRYLDAATVSMNRMLFGDTGTGAKGLGETIHDDLNSDFLKPLRDQMEKIFGPFKAIGSGLARMLFGTKDENGNYQGKFLSNFANKTRDVFRDIKSKGAGIFYKDLDQVRRAREERKNQMITNARNEQIVEDNIYSTIESGNQEYERPTVDEEKLNKPLTDEDYDRMLDDFPFAARGRKVTKTGVVAVSEGELIIPSEMNPFYHKKTNKAEQVKNETNAARKFFGFFDGGGTVKDDGKGETKPESIPSKVTDGVKNLRDSAKEKIDKNMEEKGLIYQAYEAGQKARDIILGRTKKAMDKIVGTDKDLDKLKDNLLRVKDSIFSDQASTTDKLAGGAAGALIGGGAGLLLGAPILGASIGGAAGIIIKSKATQKVLFGDDETGDEGVLPKKVSDFMQKNIPSIAKGAGIGAGIGLFMGSPVMGALLGSAVGYVKSSDKAKNLIFGEMKDGERQGGIIPKEVQQGIKKAYPNIAIGALGGALFGPLGLAGNIIMGSAVGYATSTDKFKKWLFGEEGEGGTPVGGFVKLVKENVANPIVDIFTSIGERIRTSIRSVFHNLGKEIRQIVFRQFKSALSPFARIGKGLLGKGARLLEGVIGNDKFSIGTILRGAARRSQNKNLRKGNRIWDRENKQWLGAEGRQQWAEERGIDRGIYGMIDDAMLGKNETLKEMTVEKARRLNKDLRSLYDSGKTIDLDYRKMQTDAFGVTANLRTDLNSRTGIDGGKLKESNKILSSIEKDIKKGKFERAFKSMAELEELGIIDQKDFDNLMSKLNSAKEKFDLKEDHKDRGNEALEDVLAEVYGKDMAAKMVKMKDSDIAKVLDNLKVDIKSMDLKTDAALSEEEAAKEKEALMQEAVVEKIPNAIYDLIAAVKQRYEGNKATEAEGLAEDETSADSNTSAENIGDGTKTSSSKVSSGTKKTKTTYLKSDMRKELVSKGIIKDNWKFKGQAINVEEEKVELLFLDEELGEWYRRKIRMSDVPKFLDIKDSVEIASDVINGSKTTGSNKSSSKSEESSEGLKEEDNKEIGDGTKESTEPQNGDTRVDKDGNKQIFTNGEWRIDNTDSETRKNESKKDRVFNLLENHLPGISGAIGGVSGILGGIKGGLLGDGKDKKGILGSLKEKLFGDGDENGGLLGKLANFFINPNFKGGLQMILTGAKGLALPAAFALALGGAFDKLGANLSNSIGALKGNDTKATLDKQTLVSKNTGKTVALDKNGEVITNEDGLIQMTDGTWEDTDTKYIGTDNSISTNLKRNIINGVITSSTSTGTKMLGKTAKALNTMANGARKMFGKEAKEIADIAGGKNGVSAISNVTSTLTTGIMEKVDDILLALPKIVKKLPFVGKYGDAFAAFLEPFREAIVNALKNASKKLTKIADALTAAAPYLKIAYLAGVAVNAWGNAESILGITDKASFGQKVIATLLAVVNAAIPFVGDLIPNKVLVNIFMTVAPKIGIDVSDLQEQRDKANAEVEAYNAEHGTDYSIEEYNQEVLNRAGIFTKAKNGIKNFFGGNKKKNEALSKQAQEAQKSTAEYAIEEANASKYASGYAAVSEGEVIITPEGAPASNYLGQYAEGGIVSRKQQILQQAAAKTENIYGKGTMNTILKGSKSFGSENLDKIDETSGSVNDYLGISELFNLAKEGEVAKVIKYGVGGNKVDSPTEMVAKNGIYSVLKQILIPMSFVTSGGKTIKSLWEKVTGKDSETYDEMSKTFDKMKQNAENGKISDVFKAKLDLEKMKASPMSGIYKGIFFVSKIFYTVYAAIKKVFGFLGGIFSGIKDKVIGKLKEWGIVDDSEINEDVEYPPTDKTTTVSSTIVNAANIGISTANKVIRNNKYQQARDVGLNIATARMEAAAGSGFISQMDPRYAGQKLGKSTVAEMGCGPAVAAMALNMRAKGSNMDEAINVARGYQTPQGTDASYFGDYYRLKGVEAKYYSDPYDIYNSIAAGTPTVLMGRDGSNTSKRRSPFGPNNHYVVASGFDKNGRVIINDPEMKRPRSYSTEILNNVRMAVGMGSGLNGKRRFGIAAGGGPLRVDDTTKYVWAFLTNNGFSKEAAAGVMGNMDAESGINPTAVQPNGDHAIGLCQWTYERANGLKSYASSKGTDWTDLHTQLEYFLTDFQAQNYFFKVNGSAYRSTEEYKRATNVEAATRDFLRAFERAGTEKLPKRVEAAVYYYNQFSGDTIDMPEVAPVSVNDIGDSNNKSSGMSTGAKIATGVATAASFAEGGSLLDRIKGAFTTAFGMSTIFGGLNSGSESASSNVSYDGSTISSNPTIPNFAPGASPVDYMRSVAGKLQYSQQGPRNPEQGSADCSSTVQWAIKKATGKDIGGNTGAQYNDDDLVPIWYDGGKVAQTIPPNIQPNDILFFRRSGSSNPDGVGHVELYAGNGKRIGHGGPKLSDLGPKEKDLSNQIGVANGLIKVSRLKTDIDTSSAGALAKTSGLNVRTAEMEMRQSAAGSGLMDYIDAHRDQLEAYSRKNVSGYSKYASRTRIPRGRSIDKNVKAFIGAGAAGINNQSGTIAVKSMAVGDDKKSIALLVKSLIPLVEAIVKNTNSIDGIYKLVAQLVQQGGGTSEEATKAFAMISESMKSNKDIDSDLQGLKDTVNRILAG